MPPAGVHFRHRPEAMGFRSFCYPGSAYSSRSVELAYPPVRKPATYRTESAVFASII